MSGQLRGGGRRRFIAGAGALGAAAAFPAPASAQAGGTVRLRIGYQFGLVYAPILLMKELKLAERYSKSASVEFFRVGSGAVVRDQLIAKQLDVGVLGPPPFLTGWQHLNWKYVVGTGIFPFQLVTWRDDIKSLKDFKPNDKIAVPGPSSLQSILLGMGAKKYLGNAQALQKNLVSLPHPEATAAMLSKNPSVVAHFANIPFLFQELDTPGIRVVLDGVDAFGGIFMSPLAFVDPDFAEKNPLAVGIFIAAYNDAVAMLSLEPDQAAKVLAPGLNQPQQTVLRWITWPGMTYTSLPYGIMGWHEFMLNAGFIKKTPGTLSDICSRQMLAWIGIQAGKEKNPVQKLQERNVV